MSDVPYFDTGTGKHVLVDGAIVERDALHIAERLQEYDPNLRVMCLDPLASGLNDAPFVICGVRPDTGAMYKIFECWKLDQSVLDRIESADQHRHDAISKVESMESVQKKLASDRYNEKRFEMADLVASAVKNRTSSFVYKDEHGEKVTIHEDKPVGRGHERSYSYTKGSPLLR